MRKVYEPKPRFTQEQYEKAASTDVLKFLQERGYEFKKTGGSYKAKGVHGGFVVNNNLWNWFARGIGGTAIDYLSKIEGMDFVNAVACVSDSCREVFEAVCPELKGKTASVHNCFNYAQMRLAAERFDTEYTNGTLNIFTSARISSEKGMFRMLPIFERLKNKGCSFVWRIAGSGAEYESALAESKKRNLSDNIVFLGLQKNPYPYFKSADLVLVPSYDEAAPMVYGEAMTFGIPILTTNTVSAKELVEKNAAGFVCDNSDEAIESTLEALLKNPEKVYNSKYQPKGDNKIALKEFDSIIRGKTL